VLALSLRCQVPNNTNNVILIYSGRSDPAAKFNAAVMGSLHLEFWGEDPCQTGSVFAVNWHYGRKKPVEKEML
jgi:hypothetical protein